MKVYMSWNDDFTNSETYIDKVFVYGTLMKGFSNYKRYLEGRIRRVTPGRTRGLLYHLPEGYPALLEGSGIVEGEIMEPVDEALLKTLDWLEGYDKQGGNNEYVREVRNILTEEGQQMNCWIYIYADEKYAKGNGILVTDGNWKKFMGNKGTPVTKIEL